MEASALHAPVGLTRKRSTMGLAVLRLRSDEQLVALLRAGHDEAFQVIHDRYRQRLFAYMRQMLSQRQDVEDALQDVFERAYWNLRSGDRELALRPWLYRIAHNRCIDQLRRPLPPPPEAMLQLGATPCDPIIEADRREAVRRLMADVRRLPEQQRSALLMRELGGISYAEVAEALGVTVPAVKSLLVRARISLVQAVEARDTACEQIRAELVLAHEGRVRPGAMARRHLRDCPGCREFRGHLRGVRRQLLALTPSVGACGLLARILSGGGGTGGGTAAACGGSAASGLAGGGASGLAGGGFLSCGGALATSAGHVATLLAATVVTAGGAAALQHTIAPVLHPRHHARATVHAHIAAVAPASAGPTAPAPAGPSTASTSPLPRTSVAAAAAQPGTARAATAGATAVTVRRSRRHLPPTAADQSLAPPPDPGGPSTVSTGLTSASSDPAATTGTSGTGGSVTATGTGTGATTGSSTGSSTTGVAASAGATSTSGAGTTPSNTATPPSTGGQGTGPTPSSGSGSTRTASTGTTGTGSVGSTPFTA